MTRQLSRTDKSRGEIRVIQISKQEEKKTLGLKEASPHIPQQVAQSNEAPGRQSIRHPSEIAVGFCRSVWGELSC